MVQITSTRAALDAVEHARSVELAAYLLRPDSPVVGALEDAARNGADVHVRVDGNPYRDQDGAIGQASRAAVRELRAHGVDADVVTDRRMHLKAAVVDGLVFLDDRNWTTGGHDTVVASDEADDVALVRSAIETGRAGTDSHLSTGKIDALQLESDVIEGRNADAIDIESESFGTIGGPYMAIKQRAKAGDRVRLIVSQNELRGSHAARERGVLRTLQSAGVAIRVGSSRSGVGNEKLCVAGDCGWVGSANASFGLDNDWGMVTGDPRLVGALQQRFDDNWRASVPYVA